MRSARCVRASPFSRAAWTPSSTLARRLAGLAAAEIAVLANDDLVERTGRQAAVVTLVLVAAIARDADV
jgi:hypothetical protein